jgi:hypothetical protein
MWIMAPEVKERETNGVWYKMTRKIFRPKREQVTGGRRTKHDEELQNSKSA